MNGEGDEVKDLKALIRSVLIPAKDGLTLREFEGDYKEFIGKEIPFCKYGFSSLRAFLQSQHDVVRFVRDASGNERLKSVSDESTKHIEKLVASQKSSKKRRGRGGFHGYHARGGRGGGYGPRGGRGPLYPLPRGRQPLQPLLGLSTNLNVGPTINPLFGKPFQNRWHSGLRNSESSGPRPLTSLTLRHNVSQSQPPYGVGRRIVQSLDNIAENGRGDRHPMHYMAEHERSPSQPSNSSRSPSQTEREITEKQFNQTENGSFNQTHSGYGYNQHHCEQSSVDIDNGSQQSFYEASSSSRGRGRALRGRHHGRVSAGYQRQAEAEHGHAFDRAVTKESGVFFVCCILPINIIKHATFPLP